MSIIIAGAVQENHRLAANAAPIFHVFSKMKEYAIVSVLYSRPQKISAF